VRDTCYWDFKQSTHELNGLSLSLLSPEGLKVLGMWRQWLAWWPWSHFVLVWNICMCTSKH